MSKQTAHELIILSLPLFYTNIMRYIVVVFKVVKEIVKTIHSFDFLNFTHLSTKNRTSKATQQQQQQQQQRFTSLKRNEN
ncbi:hypothetical protein N9D57_01945 [bacterium]|nr:hypothetical protein [bacterium]